MLSAKKKCSEEFLNMLNLSGLPQYMLKLKVYTVVILLHNMNIKRGHCNGTRYLIKSISQYCLELEKIDCNPDDKNQLLILLRILM